MTLQTNAECTKIIKKSKSRAFDGIQVGDIVNFSVPIRRVGRGSCGTYAACIRCYNTRTNQVSTLSFNQIEKILSNFEFLELEVSSFLGGKNGFC